MLEPQAAGAEESLLGALLMAGATGPAASDAVVARVRETGLAPSDFYALSRGTIYRAAVAVAGRHEPTDVILVADELRRRNEFEEIGGEAKLSELAYLTTATSNAEHYARLAKDASDRLRQQQIGKAIVADADAGVGIGENQDLRDKVRSLLEPRRGTGLQPLPLAEMLAGPLPPIEWHCDPLIERRTVGALVADGYAGKSLLALDLVLALRTGSPFLGFDTSKTRCGYIDLENSEREVNRRLRKLGLAADDVDGLVYIKERVDLGDAAGVARLRSTIEAESLELVVLDSFRRLAPRVDENDSSAIAGFFAPLLALRDELGTTFAGSSMPSAPTRRCSSRSSRPSVRSPSQSSAGTSSRSSSASATAAAPSTGRSTRASKPTGSARPKTPATSPCTSASDPSSSPPPKTPHDLRFAGSPAFRQRFAKSWEKPHGLIGLRPAAPTAAAPPFWIPRLRATCAIARSGSK